VTARLFLTQLARESRGARGRLTFFALCLAVGVAAVVAVAGFSASLRAGLRSEAKRLLAADLKIEGRRPIPEEVERLLAETAGAETTRVTELVTVVAAPQDGPGAGRSRLVELKAIEGRFPFYGELALDPPRPLEELLADGGAVAAPELFERLGLETGDELAVGGRRFRLTGRVTSEPDRLGTAFALGPRLFLSGESLRATGLAESGSRIERRILIRLPEDAGDAGVEALATRLRTALPDPAFFRIETSVQGQPELRRGVDRTERFLGIVALLSLVVGGVGVAQTVRTWLASRLDSIAVWKALGGRPRELAALYAGQTLVLALAGSSLGAAAGLALERAIPRLLEGLLPDLPQMALPWGAVARGIGLGVGAALLFALAPLAAALRVPAARVLRRDVEPLPLGRAATILLGLLLGAGVTAFAALQARSLLYGLAFAGGLAATAALLALGARALVGAARRAPRLRLALPLRHGLAALGRPGSASVAAIVALGIGTMVVLGMRTIETGLADRLRADLPTDAPTAFLIDIQPSQWEGVRAEIGRAGARSVDSVPVVMARLGEIDGTAVADLARAAGERRERRWALTREQRLTYLEKLPPDNAIVEGALWSDPDAAEVSVEEEFARDMGLRLGSRIVFDVQGVPVEVRVTSIRSVRWETFGINFFLVVEPGVLERAPQMRIAAVRLPPGGEQRLQDALAASYPNVTLFAIRDVLEKVAAVLDRIGLGVRFLGGFTALAGIAILAGAIAAGAALRGREVALVKSLGMTRGGVAALFATEYALAGALAGAIGAVAGVVLAWVVLERGMEIPWRPTPLPPLAAVAGAALLAAGAGLAASLRALARRPLEALRAE
jgi:putative ABC transport system permease protein